MSNTLSWNSKFNTIFKRKTKTITSLEEVNYTSFADILSIIPLRVDILPPPQSFSSAKQDKLFQGIGRVLNIQKQPNAFRKGKGKIPLHNITVYLEDHFSTKQVIQLRFFNCYPSISNKLENIEELIFQGRVQIFNGALQIINPNFKEFNSTTAIQKENSVSVIYPTINGIKPTFLSSFFSKLPLELWNDLDIFLQDDIAQARGLISLATCYKILHGQITIQDISEFNKAKERLIYNEFLEEQIKILVRRQLLQTVKTPAILVSSEQIQTDQKLFPYELTPDQKSCLNDIIYELSRGYPMMKLIQGDVGSGKTTVAILAALLVIRNGGQVALMCPTESLALQHYKTITSILKYSGISIDILIGGQKENHKRDTRLKLEQGLTDFIIGTHSLIQQSVSFKNLGLAIIDEQHKFGVNQRIQLSKKGDAVHTIIMTATPIPRSLSLTQYGDLDISVIKTMPHGRKGIQTRIVTPATFEKFLSFLKTRLSLNEQAFIVVPAIFEQEEQSFITLEKANEKFVKFFPEYKISTMHGHMKTEEKSEVLQLFANHQSDILLATSVIEVGIDVPNATIMAILSPERFGLSSLHQLRGRVGRGAKAAFCFLVTEKPLAKESMQRLQIIENSTDGFEISEKDLELRGEGNLFGTDQSGEHTHRLGNIISHSHLLEQAKQDLVSLLEQKNPQLLQKISQLLQDEHIIKTI